MKKLVTVLLSLCCALSLMLAIGTAAGAETVTTTETVDLLASKDLINGNFTAQDGKFVSKQNDISVLSMYVSGIDSVKVKLQMTDSDLSDNNWMGFIHLADAHAGFDCACWSSARTATSYVLRIEKGIIFLNRLEGTTWKNHEGDGGLSNYAYGIADSAAYFSIAHEYELALSSNETETSITVKDNGAELFTAKDTSANRKTSLDGVANVLVQGAEGLSTVVSGFSTAKTVVTEIPDRPDVPEAETETVDLIASEGTALYSYVKNDGKLYAEPNAVSIVSSASLEKVKSVKVKMSFADESLDDNGWIGFIHLGDGHVGYSSPSWVAERTATAYVLRLEKGIIFLNRLEGTAWKNHEGDGGLGNYVYNVADPAAYYALEHEYEFVLTANDSSTLITVKDNGVELFTAQDTSANRKTSLDGNVNILSQGGVGLSTTISAFSATVEKASAPVVPDQPDVPAVETESFDVLGSSHTSLWSFNKAEGGITSVENQVCIAGISLTKVHSVKIRMSFADADLSDNGWLTFIHLADGHTGYDSPCWVSSRTATAYVLRIEKNVIFLNRLEGTAWKNHEGDGGLSGYEFGIADTAAYFAVEHEYEIKLSSDDEKTSITVIDNGAELFTAQDASENRLTSFDGYYNVISQGAEGLSTTVSAFSAEVEKGSAPVEPDIPDQPEKPEPPTMEMFGDEEVKDVMDNVAVIAGAERLNGKLTLSGADVQLAATGRSFESIRLAASMKIDVSAVSADYSDWLMFLHLSDSTPGVPMWVSETAGDRYILGFYSYGIKLFRYNGANGVELVGYAVEEGFYQTAHEYKIMLDVVDGGANIAVEVDGDRIMTIRDDSESAILAGGAVSFIGQGPMGVKTEVTALRASDFMPLTTDFDFDSISNQFDHTDIADKFYWNGTYQEPEYVEQTVFYKGGTKDNVYLGGVDIKTVGTFATDYADMVMTFKMTVTWPEFASDWGAIYTFRDSIPGLAVWGANQENQRYCYALMFWQDAYGIGSIQLVRYFADAQSVGLATYGPIALNGVEHSYKVAVKDIDTNSDGANDAVRIVVLCDGDAIFDVIDNDAEKSLVGKTGGVMYMNHLTRHCFVQGTKPGEAVEELVINPAQPDEPDQPENPGDSPSSGGYEDEIPGGSSGASSEGGCFSMAGSGITLSLAALAMAAVALKRRRNN